MNSKLPLYCALTARKKQNCSLSRENLVNNLALVTIKNHLLQHQAKLRFTPLITASDILRAV